jgi:hypothetical protein
VAGNRFEAKTGVEAHRDLASHGRGIGWRRNGNGSTDDWSVAPVVGSVSARKLGQSLRWRRLELKGVGVSCLQGGYWRRGWPRGFSVRPTSA